MKIIMHMMLMELSKVESLRQFFFQKIQHIYFPWLSGYNAEVFSTTGLKLLL